MAHISGDLIDGCVRLRLTSGDTNMLTTDLLHELSAAIADAESNGRGILLCGGEKFFSNGVDLNWALTQSTAQMSARVARQVEIWNTDEAQTRLRAAAERLAR